MHSILFNLTKKYLIKNKKDVFYLFYYSLVESILLLIIPLISAFIINSVLAHATISVIVLSFIVVVVLMVVTFLQIIKEYIVEKFEQKIFVNSAFDIVNRAKDGALDLDKEKKDKYLNYFFDVLSIQKFLPVIVLNSYSLVLKVLVSMLLLLAFDVSFFLLGLFFIVFYLISIFLIGKNGIRYAIERSDAKHESIYFIHKMVMENKIDENLSRLDDLLSDFIKKRSKLFKVVISQFSLTYILEGIVLSTFFILGAYLVYEGIVPIGEFIATEIVVISIISALKEFIKQLDYIYEISEGLYKVEKLSKILGRDERV